jgi:hypothetical protein
MYESEKASALARGCSCIYLCSALRGNWCFSRDTLLTLGARDGIFVERRITFSGR